MQYGSDTAVLKMKIFWPFWTYISQPFETECDVYLRNAAVLVL